MLMGLGRFVDTNLKNKLHRLIGFCSYQENHLSFLLALIP